MQNDEQKNINLAKDLQSKDKAKSRKAFDEIYRMYSEMVYKICRVELKNSYLTKDVFQATFIQFYEYVSEGNDIKNIRNILYTIAKNCCINEHKRLKHTIIEDTEFISSNYSEVDTETQEIVRNAVQNLEEIYREPIILREYLGMTYKEICEILNITEAQLTMRLFRAKKTLAKILEPIINEKIEYNRQYIDD